MRFHRLELELKTVTPAFIGASDPASGAEWTAKSVRGHLRWWLRAVMGGELQGDANAVRQLESGLFGATSQKSPLKILTPSVRESGTGQPVEGTPYDEAQLADSWGTKDAAAKVRRGVAAQCAIKHGQRRRPSNAVIIDCAPTLRIGRCGRVPAQDTALHGKRRVVVINTTTGRGNSVADC